MAKIHQLNPVTRGPLCRVTWTQIPRAYIIGTPDCANCLRKI